MRSRSLNVKKNMWGYFFIAPFMIVFVIFGLFPIIYTFQLSFDKWNGFTEAQGIGFANYLRILADGTFPKTIWNTLKIWLCDYIPQLLSALVLSLIFTFYRIKGMKVFRAVYYLPSLITAASIGLLFNILLNGDKSTVNQLLLAVRVIEKPISYFKSETITQGVVSFILWWMWFGYTTILVMAGMTSIDPELYEAAEIDGCSRGCIFSRITIPLIRPTLIYITITSIIGGMQIFDVPVNVTNLQGDPQKAILTSSMYIYQQAFKNTAFGYASALSVILFFVIALLSFFAFRFMNRRGK